MQLERSCRSVVIALVLAAATSISTAAESPAACTLETPHVKYVLGTDGRCLGLLDKRTAQDYCSPGHPPLAAVEKAGKRYASTAAAYADGLLTVRFGESGVQAVLRPSVKGSSLVLEVVSLTGDGADELTFLDIPLTLKGEPGEPLAACVLALNLQTDVREMPRPNSRLRATCCARFGFAGASAAIIACPLGQMRQALQEAVKGAKDLPQSAMGGPFAMDQPITRGSYLFNFANLSEDKVDEWIALARRLGMTQIDFHGGSSFRFGDCRPNPATYPRGLDSLKAVIDRLHAAGISAGLHTYAFFIAKDCPWVTPVPDPRLAKDATFTLAQPLEAKGDRVAVAETTEKMSAVTGFFVRNSVTVQIDDELITYSDVSSQPPYGFTGCRRGAWGTKPAAHAAGAKVHHLKECFGLFVPDPETTLLAEVATRTAGAYNHCGFDMIYLDALDGEDILGGGRYSWHYGSKYVYELCKRLKKPALIEMSTFHHHLWCVRSRHGAWDHPTRSHKRFIDVHVRDNEQCRRMFLPAQLGWWALKSWTGPQGEPTFADDIEYLMGKCLGTDTGMAMMGIDPSNVDKVPALPRLADIIRRYENLRHSGKVGESVKARLRRLGEEFTLEGDLETGWRFRPVRCDKHRVDREPSSRTWQSENPFARQAPRLRIEALMAAGPYDAADAVVLADFAAAGLLARRTASPAVTVDLQPSKEQVKVGPFSGCYAATNATVAPRGAWTCLEKTFSPPLNLSARQALGVWVHGDGGGQVLNLQLRTPEHLSHGIGDHYIPIDFTGWRYFELIEPEGERWADYAWPYGNLYAIYRESVNFSQVDRLAVWYNHLPPGRKAACYLSPVKALPLVATRLIRPSITAGGKTITFPVEIASGQYLEYNSPSDCKLYGPKGELVREVSTEGEPPLLEPDRNEIRFDCGSPDGVSARARVTVITRGEPIQ